MSSETTKSCAKLERTRFRLHLIVILAVIAIAIGLCAANIHWRRATHLDNMPERWDEAHFTGMSIRLHRKICDDPREAYAYFISGSPNQGPLITLGAACLYFIIPPGVESALCFNAICVALLGVMTYLIGIRHRFSAGVFAATIVVFFGPVICYMRLFRTELPLAALVATAIYFLIRADRFKNTGWTIAAAVVCGLAILTNPIAIIYLLWPVLYCVVRGQWQDKLSIGRLLNVSLGIALTFIIASVWIYPNITAIKNFLLGYGFGPYAALYRDSTRDLLKYPKLLWRDVGLPLFVLTAVSSVLAIVSRRKNCSGRKFGLDLWLIASWAACSFIFLNLTRDQQTRFLLPLLPAVAVFVGVIISTIRQRPAIIAATILLALTCASNVNTEFSKRDVVIAKTKISADSDWKLDDISLTIARDTKSYTKRPKVAFLVRHAFFTAKGFELEALVEGYDFEVIYMGNETSLPQITEHLVDADYAVLKTGMQEEEDHLTCRDIPVKEALKCAKELGYSEYARFTLPDNSEAILLKKIRK